MIYQSQNEPIYCDAGVDLTGASYIEVTLYNELYGELKRWTKDDLTDISGSEFTAPLTQEESAKFPRGECFLEMKAILSGDDFVTMWKAYPMKVGRRFDRTKIGDET